MNTIRLFFIVLAAACPACMALAQDEGPDAAPTISFYDTENLETVEIAVGESKSTHAPCDITCTANLNYDPTEFDKVFCEWKIYRADEGETKPLVDRFDENITYTLTQSGGYGIKFIPTFINSEKNDTVEVSYEFSIVISESKLICPDGFSPNGDGINDKLEIEYQSLVKLEGYVLNRWGQKLHTFTLDNLSEGWDGMVNGKPVKDGAYLIHLEAIGSDGLHYRIKKAINVLKGFREDADANTDS